MYAHDEIFYEQGYLESVHFYAYIWTLALDAGSDPVQIWHAKLHLAFRSILKMQDNKKFQLCRLAVKYLRNKLVLNKILLKLYHL